MDLREFGFDFVQIEVAVREGMPRLKELAQIVTSETMNDGSDISLEYALLAMTVLEHYLWSLRFALQQTSVREKFGETMEAEMARLSAGKEKAWASVRANILARGY